MIETPSQYFSQLKSELESKLVGSITVAGYDDIRLPEIKSPTVLIQFEDSYTAARRTTGRYTHRLIVTAHCVVPTSVEQATLVATDLAFEVERIMDLNRCGVDSKCCGAPEIQVNGDTSFLFHWSGVESRGVQWIQPLYLGADYFDDEEPRGGIRVAINPEHPEEPGEYQPFWPEGE